MAASRTAREYNQRKSRRGAFWEDRYHATAVESGKHLNQCMAYIDLNMVRAGRVRHPAEWPFCGYNEIVSNRQRYRLIATEKLLELLHIEDRESLRKSYAEWIEFTLESTNLERESRWTESIAVGKRDYVETIKTRLGIRANYRDIKKIQRSFVLKELGSPYK